MTGDFLKYISIIGMLIFVYLVVYYGSNSTQVLGAISKANSNTILALQGRNPQ